MTIKDLTPEQIQAISDNAQGTCKSAEDLANDAGLGDEPNGVDLVNEAIADIGEHGHCDQCGWWCEMSEMRDDGVCTDCGGEQGEGEDD